MFFMMFFRLMSSVSFFLLVSSSCWTTTTGSFGGDVTAVAEGGLLDPEPEAAVTYAEFLRISEILRKSW